ncbi:hypothetical protein AGMMS50239_29960 [Bacteroidia bacterium]|nr:hypothetical protein AGMMS50239_29960 [Bacteroidia bacterium]
MQSKKSHIIRNLCILLAFWSLSAYAPAQTTVYPVQAYTQLIPPYTPYTPSYYSGGVEKMRVTLINADMMQPLLEVYLKMKITSSVFSLQTPEEVRTPPITLPAGVPVILSRSDLEPYFRRENLQVGGGQSQFYRTLMLPDNFYRFHFEVYEVHTGRLLSNTRVGFAQALIAAGDPPVLNLPLKSSVVEESNIPSILFTWTPRHMNSVASAYGTEYEISLVEIHDKQTSAENAFQYSRVLHSERTRSTAFIYNSAHPLLQPGLRYAWRVQAVAREGLEEAQVFKNNGYSEIFWFDYKGNCPAVTSSGVVIKGMEAAVSWQPTQAIGYTLEYRKKGGARWYGANVSGTSGTFYGLQWGETYEYRIGSRCYPDDLLDYSTVKAFTMPELPEKNPNCGILPDDNVSNRTPISELTPGLPVFAGDFPVFITEVHGNGVFSGTGYIGIPFTKLPRITVTFSNITVNTDHRLIGGFFETKYDIRNKNLLWDVDQTLTGGGGGVGDIRTGEERAQFVVDCTINPDIKVKPVVTDGSRDEIKEGESYVFTRNENGKYEFIITDSKGNEHRIESETMPVTIEDKEGKTYRIDEQGNITQVSSESGIKLDPSVCYKVETDIVEVAFAEIEGVTRYAVDPYRDVYKNVTEYYQQYKAGDREIAASAKFMLPGTSDKLAVKITSSKAGFDPSKVHFVTMSGKEYEAVYMPGDKQWGITVVASAAGDGQELFAVYETEPGKYATVALLNIYTYEPKTIKVKLVPVNGFTNGFSKESVSAQLNAIYNKVGVSCEIEMASSFNYTFHDNTFNVTGSGLFSTQTSDMKAINSAYQQGNDYQTDAITLFIIENVTGDDGVAGDMPRGKQFGYLFAGSDTRTIAHEIGHGAFNLEHPFERPLRGQFEKGQLAHCLMDYGTGTEFCKLEWDAINAPGLVIGMLETDEGGMDIIENNPKAIVRIIKTIQCAKSKNEKQTVLYFPSSSIEVKIKDLVSTLNLAGSDCSGEKIKFYLSNSDYSNLSGDYIQDLFNISTIKFDDNNKQVVIQGDKITCFVSPLDKFSSKADCIYSFIKSLFTVSFKNENYNVGTPTLEDLQYASPCEFETLKIEDRKKLLQEASKAENWYNSSIKDSRQKIAILLISTTPNQDKTAMYSLFSQNLALLNTLYTKVDDYRDELLQAIVDLWKYNNSNAVAKRNILINQYSLLHQNTFWKVNDNGKYQICFQYLSGGNPYSGFQYESDCTNEINPFETVNIYAYTSLWSRFSGKSDAVLLDVPAIVGRTIMSDAYKQEFYNYLTLGFSVVGVNQTAIAAKMLANGGIKSIGVWVKFALGASDVTTTVVEEYVKGNPNTEFSKTWVENRNIIYGSLLVANLTDAAITAYANKAKQMESLYLKETGTEFAEIGTNTVKGGNKLNLGKFIKKIGDYEVYEGGEVFYRGMTKSDYEYLLKNNKLQITSNTSEMFTSPSLEYIKSVGYGDNGIIVKIQAKQGTLKVLEVKGIRDQSIRAAQLYPEMPNPQSFSGWMERGEVYFKQETIKGTNIQQINIGLGRNTSENGGLKLFNDNIIGFEIVE